MAAKTDIETRVRVVGFDGIPAKIELTAFGHSIDQGTQLWLFITLYIKDQQSNFLPSKRNCNPILNVIPAYIWYSAPTGALTFVNERTANFLGLPEDDPVRFGIDVGGAWHSHIPLLHLDDNRSTRNV